jgi:hypothetical protein
MITVFHFASFFFCFGFLPFWCSFYFYFFSGGGWVLVVKELKKSIFKHINKMRLCSMNAFTILFYFIFFLAQRKIISLQKGGEKKNTHTHNPKVNKKKNHTHNQKAMNQQLEPILLLHRTKNYSPPITHDLCSSKLCISLKDKWGIHGESLSALLPFISLKQRWDIHLEFL